MVFLLSFLFAFSAFLDTPAVKPSSVQVASSELVGPFVWDDNPFDNEAVKAAERFSHAGGGARVLRWVFQSDDLLPERCYPEALKLRRLVKAYSSKWDVYHVETLPVDTNDVVAVKRALRFAIMDAARELDSSFELFCKSEVTASRLKTEGNITRATFKCLGLPYVFVWRSDLPPSELMQAQTNDFTTLIATMEAPVRVELLTGEIEPITNAAEVIISDSPILLAPASRVPGRIVFPDGYSPYMDEAEVPVCVTNRNEFGGRLDGPKLKATGRFRVAHVNGKWSLVDPNGYLYRAWGPHRVSYFGTNLDHGQLLKRYFKLFGCTAIGPETDLGLVLGNSIPYILTVETAADLSRYEQVKGDKWCLGVYVKEGCGLKATQKAVRAFDPYVLYFGGSARYCDVATVKVKRDMPQVRIVGAPEDAISSWSELGTVGVFWTHDVNLFDFSNPTAAKVLNSIDPYEIH